MNKKLESRIAAAKKWLERNEGVGATTKLANAAITAAEKSILEAKAAKTKYEAATEAKEKAVLSMGIAMEKARTEKRLKAKEAKLQTRLASLVASEKTS